MKATEREQKIIGLLESRGEIPVAQLSDILGVSVSTLRKQLAVMCAKGLVIRTYGGVMSINRVPDETFESKLYKNESEKKKIAECARKMVAQGTSIALGSGTTVFALGCLLSDITHGTIYTNSMQTADHLSHYVGPEVHICGGIIRSHTGTLIGSEVVEYFRSLKPVDYAFISCDAIDGDGAVFSENLSVATVEKTILLCTKQKYILCDSSKIGRTAVGHIINLKECDGLITCRSNEKMVDHYQYLTNVFYA